MTKKTRADQLLVDQDLVETRSRAQALILAGLVEQLSPTGWKNVLKAGEAFLPTTKFRVLDPHSKDVSRGAQKLRRAFAVWPELRDLAKGAQCLDIGSSTGGFTQVLLEMNAERVLALDVGTHQLHERLRQNSKVISVEQTHVLKVGPEFFLGLGLKPRFSFMVTDVSFISVKKVLIHAHSWLEVGGAWIVLVKPQFELEAKKIARGGIVKDPLFREEALKSVIDRAASLGSFKVVGHCESPIKGTDGNVEYLLCLMRIK